VYVQINIPGQSVIFSVVQERQGMKAGIVQRFR